MDRPQLGRCHAPIKSRRRSSGGDGRQHKTRSDQQVDRAGKSQPAAAREPNPANRTPPTANPTIPLRGGSGNGWTIFVGSSSWPIAATDLSGCRLLRSWQRDRGVFGTASRAVSIKATVAFVEGRLCVSDQGGMIGRDGGLSNPGSMRSAPCSCRWARRCRDRWATSGAARSRLRLRCDRSRVHRLRLSQWRRRHQVRAPCGASRAPC